VAGLPRTRQRLVEEWEHFEEHRGLGRTDLKHGVRHEPIGSFLYRIHSCPVKLVGLAG
jgi:hypothetical protein